MNNELVEWFAKIFADFSCPFYIAPIWHILFGTTCMTFRAFVCHFFLMWSCEKSFINMVHDWTFTSIGP